jgi:hypothetical protein
MEEVQHILQEIRKRKKGGQGDLDKKITLLVDASWRSAQN